ncbi:MAG: InlB B-repeat-containing protein [Gaiellaceae bacterium]
MRNRLLGRCAGSFLYGTAVHFTAVPAGNYRFSGWSGACRGRTSCAITVASAASVRATFVKR